MQFGDLNVCNLFGMTCDGRDIIASNFVAPEMEVGDWLIFGGMGSYTVGPKSKFNGMEATTKVTVWNQKAQETVLIPEIEEINIRTPVMMYK